MVVLKKKINKKSNTFTYHYSQIFIHWLIALLVIYQFSFGSNIEFLELKRCISTKTNDLTTCKYINNHYFVGVAIFFLMIVRLSLRFLFGAPPLPKSIPLIIKIIARLSHFLIYFILFLMPILGIYMYYFNSEIAQFLHISFSKLLLFLILLHICAVAFHEGILGSRLFYRMVSISKIKDN